MPEADRPGNACKDGVSGVPIVSESIQTNPASDAHALGLLNHGNEIGGLVGPSTPASTFALPSSLETSSVLSAAVDTVAASLKLAVDNEAAGTEETSPHKVEDGLAAGQPQTSTVTIKLASTDRQEAALDTDNVDSYLVSSLVTSGLVFETPEADNTVTGGRQPKTTQLGDSTDTIALPSGTTI